MKNNQAWCLDRRTFIKNLVLGSVAGATGILANSCRTLTGPRHPLNDQQHGPRHSKPNIIFCLVDDQVISSLELMPTIKSQLIDKGVIFRNTFCASPLCAPARASILSGQYVHNLLPHHQKKTTSKNIENSININPGELTGSQENLDDQDEQDDNSRNIYALTFASRNGMSRSIATSLKIAGYKNIFLGKYTNSYYNKKIPPGWDEWYSFWKKPGYYDYKLNENGTVVTYGKRETDYSTDVLAQKALHFIDRQQTSRVPFFMYLSPNAPHSPRIAAPRHQDKFEDKEFYIPKYEEDISDKPQWVHEDRKAYPMRRARNEKKIKAIRTAKGLKTLLAVDEMLCSIIKKLEQNGQLENTYIFYIADNGDDYSTHIRASGKLLPYEEGIRTPLIVRGPGIEPGTQRDELVSTVDLLPTFTALAGTHPPHFTDGRSLVPLLSNPSSTPSNWRKAVLVESPGKIHWYRKLTVPGYNVLRTPFFKYIEYETGEKEFYDLGNDPGEYSNIYEKLNSLQKKTLNQYIQMMNNTSKKKYRHIEETFPIETFSEFHKKQ